MQISDKVFRAIIESCPDNKDLAKHLSEEFARIEHIGWQIAQIYKDIRKIEESAQAQIQCCKKEIADIQEKCPHYHWKFNPDAAGGSDSYSVCEICRKVDYT